MKSKKEYTPVDKLQQVSRVASHAAGKPYAFFIALALVIAWAVSGPFFGFGDTWQLVINTTTTVITFLLAFLIQATQNRDSKAIHLKLDELIRSSKARNLFADLEDASEDEIRDLQHEFEKLHKDFEEKKHKSKAQHVR